MLTSLWWDLVEVDTGNLFASFSSLPSPPLALTHRLLSAARSYLSMQVGTLQSRAMHAKGRLLLSWWQQIIGAPEKYIGFWLGNILAFLYFYLSAIVYAAYSDENSDDETDDHSAFQDDHRNPTQIAGLNCALKDPLLFSWTLVFLFITLISWTMIVFIFPDPGIVDTRDRDFFEVMEQSLQEGGGPPNATAYCRTTLVKKPLRFPTSSS
jgi:hypothetical protein